MTDWSGHIDVAVSLGILISIQTALNIYFYCKLKKMGY